MKEAVCNNAPLSEALHLCACSTLHKCQHIAAYSHLHPVMSRDGCMQLQDIPHTIHMQDLYTEWVSAPVQCKDEHSTHSNPAKEKNNNSAETKTPMCPCA